MPKVIPLSFDDKPVRALYLYNKLWFLAFDICNALRIRNVKKAISLLESNELAASTIRNQKNRETVDIVNIAGIFSLIHQTDNDQAAFKKWLVYEALPQIDQSGSKKYHYPIETVCQPGICFPKPGNVYTLTYTDLINDQYDFTLGKLLKRLNRDGNNVAGPTLEFESMRAILRQLDSRLMQILVDAIEIRKAAYIPSKVDALGEYHG